MSLNLDERIETITPFPAGQNIRVLITGLALCDLDKEPVPVKFLRHLDNHELIMQVTQILPKVDMDPIITTITIKLDKNQNVTISSSKPTSISIPPYKPILPDQDLKYLIGMKTLHGQEMVIKPDLSSEYLTSLTLSSCTFYTHQLTESDFDFEEDLPPADPPQSLGKKFCQVLGGYMKYEADLLITIEHGFPLNLPLKSLSGENYFYEIVFSNLCDATPTCKDKEDFESYYEILDYKDLSKPTPKFKLIKIPRMAGSGACLPACQGC